MNNISEMSGNSQLKLLLVEIRKVRELVAQNGIDIKDVDLVARQINQSSSQLKTQLEIFKDSFDSDKTNKDNELRDIQDNIAKLQKSLKELSDLADSGGLGGGGISDLLSGGREKGKGKGKSAKGGKAAGATKLGKLAKLGAIAGVATSALDIGMDAYDLYSGKKSIEDWDKVIMPWEVVFDGVEVSKYDGTTIVKCSIWDRFIQAYQNNKTKLNLPHRAVLCS
jgi:hypothetical protein